MGERRFTTQSSTNRESGIAQRADGHAARPHRYLSLLELVRRIVEHSDRRALVELHDFRPVFRLRDERRLRFVEYVQRLLHGALERARASGNPSILEVAYDLTLDRFSNLPNRQGSTGARIRQCRADTESAGPDCRLYFAAFLRQAETQLSAEPCGELAREELASRLLQRLVHKHFRLSYLEAARRATPGMLRYTWRTPHGDIRVWLPAELSAEQRRQWLEHHTDGIDPGSPGAAEQVRAVVRQQIGNREIVHFGKPGLDGPPAKVPANSPPRTWELAGLVAKEKAEQIDHQRPAIRALGTGKLMSLIHRVFEDLEAGEFHESQLAREFGLAKATMSRFAGSRWPHAADERRAACIPDLWRNTAQVIAAHPDLTDAAEEAGVWRAVAEVCEHKEPGKGG